MSKTARQASTGYRPSGRQCAECQRAAEDCSRLDFAAMPPAGKRDADGVQRVACRCYVRAGEAGQHPNSTGRAHAGAALLQILGSVLESADRREHQCCGALASGPHKIGCNAETTQCPECGQRGWHKLGCSQRDPERVALPATRDAGGVVTVCQRSHVVDADKMVGPCRGGPDGCADSVACPRR